jgi:hypothetical protein
MTAMPQDAAAGRNGDACGPAPERAPWSAIPPTSFTMPSSGLAPCNDPVRLLAHNRRLHARQHHIAVSGNSILRRKIFAAAVIRRLLTNS